MRKKVKSAFHVYLDLGFEHILDPSAYDHILFVVALCAIYQLIQWRRVAILVTAFTLGHSVTLALAAFNVVTLPANWIEFLVPVTIFLTALYNVIYFRQESSQKVQANYILALIFGLIHGMAFSNFFRSSLFPGQENELITQLLAFNIGVELGQLIIVAAILFTSFLAFNVLKIRQRDWNLFISGMAAGPALIMAIERIGGL
ncbi:MAG: hypothetical protein DHS20C18_24160 [Saprospiraceae bacterium]|nr:MAG: hypothetical protein DHS20C18_24160 [Saprospiraceae bacterium]